LFIMTVALLVGTGAGGRGCAKTQMLNLRVEIPYRFRRCGYQSHW